MALVPVTMLYDTKDVIDATGLLNGQILYTIDQTINKIYADVLVDGTLKRIEIGGTNTIDTVLDQDSGHAIANSAVAKLAQTVHTNLLNPTLGTTTINGVTCTNNGDGTYTLNGTANAFADIRLGPWGIANYNDCLALKVGKYKLVGTPSAFSSLKAHVGLVVNNGTTRPTSYYDDGNGYLLDHTDTTIHYEIKISVDSGAVFENVVFKPMLTTDLSATYDDFVQYSGDGELNENVADLYNNLNTTNSNLTALDTKVGAQSLLPTPSQSVTQNINTLKAEIDQINSDLSAKAPTSHSSTATTYGIGNASNYGHVKLSDNYTSSAGSASSGVGASSKAVADSVTYSRIYENELTVTPAGDGLITIPKSSISGNWVIGLENISENTIMITRKWGGRGADLYAFSWIIIGASVSANTSHAFDVRVYSTNNIV